MPATAATVAAQAQAAQVARQLVPMAEPLVLRVPTAVTPALQRVALQRVAIQLPQAATAATAEL
jgi:hypothetical protein